MRSPEPIPQPRRPPHLRAAGTALIGFGVLLLLISYAAICRHADSPWPWLLVVHEDGRRTLLDTVLFYEHAARELPLDLLLGLALGASARLASGPGDAARGRTGPVLFLSGVLLIAIVVIVAGTVVEGGPAMLADNLLQAPTRPGAPLEAGAHWHYHLLSRLALLLVPLGMAGVWRWRFGPAPSPSDRPALLILVATLASFAGLTVVFTPDAATLMLPFAEPRHLGHQAREVLTHGLITLPLAFGCCLLLVSSEPHPAPGLGRAWRSWIGAALAFGALGVALGLWLGVAAMAVDAAGYAQTGDLTTLIFPHVFEHAFTYLIVTLAAALVVASTRQQVLADSRVVEPVHGCYREDTPFCEPMPASGHHHLEQNH